ncbi:MAG: hypothetical protein ACR2JI_03105, partial [Mycobacterium sp.]
FDANLPAEHAEIHPDPQVPAVTRMLKDVVADFDGSADGWTNTAIALPFSVDRGKVTVSGVDAQGQAVTVDLDPAIGFGSLQTVFDGQRTLLIATSTGVPGQLDDLLRFLAVQPGSWSGLDGRDWTGVPLSPPRVRLRSPFPIHP